MKNIENWGVKSDDLVLDYAISGMDNFAKVIKGKTNNKSQLGATEEYEKVLKKMSLVSKRYRKYLNIAERFMNKKFNGIVVDLGSGRGTLAGVLSKIESVREVYAVEY